MMASSRLGNALPKKGVVPPSNSINLTVFAIVRSRIGYLRVYLSLPLAEYLLGAPITYLYRDTRREHHPAALRGCGLPSRWRPRRLARPSQRRPQTRFLPRATRPHSRNPQLRGWTIPANPLIARSTEVPVPPARMPRYPRFGFSREPVSWLRARFSRRLSSCRRPSFSLLPFSRRPSLPPTFSSAFRPSSRAWP